MWTSSSIGRLRPIETLTICVCLPALFYSSLWLFDVSVTIPTFVTFLVLSVLISTRPKALWIALVPVALIPTVLFSASSSFIAAIVLVVGSLILHGLLLVLDFARFTAKDMGTTATYCFAIIQFARLPARAIVLVFMAVASIVEVGVLWTHALIVPGFLFARGSYKTATITGVVAAGLTGWSVAPVSLAALCVVLEVVRLSGMSPRHQLMMPRGSILCNPSVWSRCVVFDVYLGRGDLLRARGALHRSHCSDIHVDLRAALIDLEEGFYQPALDLAGRTADASPPVQPYIRLLHGRALSGTAQFERARASYVELLEEPTTGELRLRATTMLLIAENDLDAGEFHSARRHAEHVLDLVVKGRTVSIDRLRAYRVLIEAALAAANVDDARGWLNRATDEMFESRWMRSLLPSSTSGRLVRKLFGSRGSILLDLVRFDILERRVSGDMNDDGYWEPEAIAVAMTLAGRFDDLVELLLIEAARYRDKGDNTTVMRFAARALMELDRTRYRLAAQSSRTAWAKRFERGISVALAAAHELKDHVLQAELLEFARVQTRPTANAEDVNEVGLSTPPVIQVRGRARLARPGGDRPPPVAIEHAAQRAAGAGAWWLSYWETDGWVYWALIAADDGPVHSGRIPVTAGTPLAEGLAALHQALLIPLQGEDPAAMDFRLANSPLLTDPAAELSLSRTLGQCLLPPQLVRAAHRHQRVWGTPLPLAVAPSASLGYVPWSLLVAVNVHSPDDPDPDRLLDICDWVLAPSATLLSIAQPMNTCPAPLRLAIVDTSDAPEMGELLGAREQSRALPGSVMVLGGRHWTSAVATVPALEKALAIHSEGYTATFFCHAVRGTADMPSAGGIVMESDDDKLALLRPSTIFAMIARGISMPTQVLLQACDTSALTDSASGEWLTIAPAFIVGGSKEIITTLYPIPDHHDDDSPVLRAAVIGTSLRDAVRQYQRECLVRWTSDNVDTLAHTPLTWAAYAPIAVHDVALPPSDPNPRLSVSVRLIRFLANAIRECRESRAQRLDSGYLLSEYLDESSVANMFDGADSSLNPRAMVWELGPYVCSRFLSSRDGDTSSISVDGISLLVSDTIIASISDARRAAAVDGSLIEPEHLLQQLLARPSAAHRILGHLSRLTRRHRKLTLRAIDHTLADEIARGEHRAPTGGEIARDVNVNCQLAWAVVDLAQSQASVDNRQGDHADQCAE